MKLMTKSILKNLPAMGSTDGQKSDHKVAVKFFTPDSNWTWLVFEGEKLENGDICFFGLVQGFEEEMGEFLLSELEAARGPLGLPVERDLHAPKTLAEAAPEFCKRLWG